MARAKKSPVPDSSTLGTFEGRDVIRMSIAVTSAGDGLSAALGVDPQQLHLGDEVTVVLRCVVAKVRHEEVPDTGCVVRVHVLKAGDAAIIDDAVVADVLAAQAARILEAKGVVALPFGEDLQEAHDRGEHLTLVEGCPDCDRETEAVAADG